MLLEDLDQVPWETLQHAYGPATDTPTHLRALASPDSHTREEAYYQLSQSIIHQGSIYPAAVATVPFFVELLQAKGTPDKVSLLNLLSRLALGGSWHNTHQYLELFETARETPEYQAKVEEELSWVVDLRAELEKSVDAYIDLLDHPEKRIRMHASHLISCLPNLKSRTLPALKDRLLRETDDQARANILYAISVLDLKNQGAFFERAWQEEHAALPRCIALSQLTLQAKKDTPSQALDHLLETLISADPQLIQRYNELSGVSEFLTDLAVPLALASAEHGERVLPWLIAQVEERRMVGESCAMGLLAIALLEDGHITDLDNLTEIQKRAVRAVARMAWPLPQRVFVNMVGVLRRFGLPDQPEVMGRLLGAPLF